MRSSANPVFRRIEKNCPEQLSDVKLASFKGVAIKSLILIMIAITAGIAAPFIFTAIPGALIPVAIAAGLGSFIIVLIGMMSVKMAPAMGILYSLVQGLFLGAVTAILDPIVYENFGFSNLGMSALIGVGAIFGIMFALYYFGIIKVTNRLRGILIGSLLAVFVVSLVIMITGATTTMFNNPGLAIAFSVLMIVLGAFFLTLDFNRAAQLVEMGAPAAYEWQVALGLMVTLVWLYVEILRLIIILVSRNR